jgi:hypothetical protein
MLSRRSLLRGATGLVAAAPLSVALEPGAAAASRAGAVPVPQTLSHLRRGLSSGSVLAEGGFPLTHLVVASNAPTTVRLRTADGWQPWRTRTGCAGGQDGTQPSPTTTLVPAAGALGYELRVADGGSADVTELNTVDGPARAVAAPITALPFGPAAGAATRAARTGVAAAADFRPRYLSRAAWGADESWRLDPDGSLDTPPTFFDVQTLTVHHSGEEETYPDPISHVRAIYYTQAVKKDWGDIGYHLLIDAEGRVYEGTYSDPDPVPVFGARPGTDGRPQMVNGAHVGRFNAGNIGICLLGNFMTAPPTAAARRSLTVVLALLAALTRLDPAGTTRYVNPVTGAAATVDTISGHQDWHTANPKADPTLCPGDHLYAMLPQLRRDVAVLTGLLSG